MAVLPKLIYRFNIRVPILIPAGFFRKTDELILKFIDTYNGLTAAKKTLKKSRAEGFSFPDFKTYYKVVVIKILY
jgi:hypothetical protein